MAWLGRYASVSPIDLRASLQTIAEDHGVVIRCTCGASRWCPARRAGEDASTFRRLHRGAGHDTREP